MSNLRLAAREARGNPLSAYFAAQRVAELVWQKSESLILVDYTTSLEHILNKTPDARTERVVARNEIVRSHPAAARSARVPSRNIFFP